MGRLWIAFRAFFAALFDWPMAEKLDLAMTGRLLPPPPPDDEPKKPAAPPPPKAPSRSDALSLLAALQREARLIDFVKEPLDGFSDAEIGAVARDVHRDTGKVLERMFALRPAAKEGDGASIKLPAGFDTGRYRLVGNVSGAGPFQGEVAHHGWEATTCSLPDWSGNDGSSRVVAPAEVEVK